MLTQDPSCPGKLRTVRGALNPANHDDGAPGSSLLKQAIADLGNLKKAPSAVTGFGDLPKVLYQHEEVKQSLGEAMKPKRS